ncbi:AMMECR1 domain-containing protein [Candidatus Magnetoovum chiemensis]|nr:AMMECR1 domain-containing protein [Candidatus Magnetoovum chiemensis]
MHPLVELAKEAINQYIKNRKIIQPPEILTEEMRSKAGVFVCIKKAECLRGCIGTFKPATDNVAAEIIKNAIASCTEDPRFYPVQTEELDDLTVSVDVLSEPEKISYINELDPKKYGVIVLKGSFSRGLLLPNLDGVDTVEEQLKIVKSKAQIDINDEDVEIYRFEVRRYN